MIARISPYLNLRLFDQSLGLKQRLFVDNSNFTQQSKSPALHTP